MGRRGACPPRLGPAAWRGPGALALAACLCAAVALEAGGAAAAAAATLWRVDAAGGNGGAGRAGQLAAPSGVDATCTSPIGWTITIRWNLVPQATSYTVYRHGSAGGTVGTYGASTTSVNDTQLTFIGQYHYTVVARRAGWASAASADSGKVTIATTFFPVCWT